MSRECPGRVLLSSIVLLLLASASARATNSRPPTGAEQKLLKAAMAGEIADYSRLQASQRTISADFLKRLMFETPEAKVPGKLVHIRGAILKYFDFKVDENKKLSGSVPFELVFESCSLASFVCEGCRFQRGLRFLYSTFGVPGPGEGELVLEGVQVNGNFEIKSNNTLIVSLVNARIAGTADFLLPASSALVANHMKAQTVNVMALAPANLSINSAEADLIALYIRSGESMGGKSISDVQMSDAVADSLLLDTWEPIEVFASRMRAKTAAITSSLPTSDPSIWKPVEVMTLTLDRSNIDRDIYVGNLRIGTLAAVGLTVKDTAAFNVDAKFADLSFSNFDTLDWNLHSDSKTKLNGISFRTLNVYPVPDSHPSMQKGLDFLRRGESALSAFSAYQTQLRAEGENADAERVYVAMHEKIREGEWKHWFAWPLGVIDFFQQYVLGYGRSPIPPLLWSLAFVIFGSFAFRDVREMQPKVEKPADFSGTWYSFELFLPIVDLGVAKEWRPKSVPKWRVAYARVHQMAGWVLIPVALAAITGVIK